MARPTGHVPNSLYVQKKGVKGSFSGERPAPTTTTGGRAPSMGGRGLASALERRSIKQSEETNGRGVQVRQRGKHKRGLTWYEYLKASFLLLEVWFIGLFPSSCLLADSLKAVPQPCVAPIPTREHAFRSPQRAANT